MTEKNEIRFITSFEVHGRSFDLSGGTYKLYETGEEVILFPPRNAVFPGVLLCDGNEYVLAAWSHDPSFFRIAGLRIEECRQAQAFTF